MWLIQQPLADAVYYKNDDVIKLLEQHGAKPPVITGIQFIAHYTYFSVFGCAKLSFFFLVK